GSPPPPSSATGPSPWPGCSSACAAAPPRPSCFSEPRRRLVRVSPVEDARAERRSAPQSRDHRDEAPKAGAGARNPSEDPTLVFDRPRSTYALSQIFGSDRETGLEVVGAPAGAG